MELWEFMRNNLPFAFYGNVNNEYSEEEYKLAEGILEPVIRYFENVDEGLLIESFACVIKHIRYVKNEYENKYSNAFMQRKGKGWSQYHRMIFEFNRVMQSFSYSFEGETKDWGKTFPIKEVVFKGHKKGQTIKLEGQILEILKGIFNSFNSIHGKQDETLMKEFSFDFYESYQEYMMQWSIINATKGSLARKLVKVREEKDANVAFNRYRNQTAYYLHKFIRSKFISVSKIPEWHKRFIGDLFIACGIAHDDKEDTPNYIGTSYNAVRRWIEEGEKSLK